MVAMEKGDQRAVVNLVHTSEDSKTAEREISVWFKKEELVDYKRADEGVMFPGH